MQATVIARTNPNVLVHRVPTQRFTKAYRYGHGPVTHNVFDIEAFRAKCIEVYENGLDNVPADAPDRLAVTMKFVYANLRVDANGRVSQRQAFAAYCRWATALQAPSMPLYDFRENLREYVKQFAGGQVTRQQSPTTGDHYTGLSL